MMGESHSRAGVVTWFALTTAQTVRVGEGPDVWQVAAGAVLVAATSRGWLSPDADGHRWLGKVIPGGHRGPLHCPDLVCAVGALLWYLSASSPAHFAVGAVIIGWLSHLLGDALFGGVPFFVLGARRRYGLRLDTDGWFERWVVRRLLLVFALVAGVLALATALDPTIPGQLVALGRGV